MSPRSSKLPGMPPSNWGLLWRQCCPHTNPRSRCTAWAWGSGHVLPASCQFTIVPLDGLVLGVAVEAVAAVHSVYRAGTKTLDGGCGGG